MERLRVVVYCDWDVLFQFYQNIVSIGVVVGVVLLFLVEFIQEEDNFVNEEDDKIFLESEDFDFMLELLLFVFIIQFRYDDVRYIFRWRVIFCGDYELDFWVWCYWEKYGSYLLKIEGELLVLSY